MMPPALCGSNCEATCGSVSGPERRTSGVGRGHGRRRGALGVGQPARGGARKRRKTSAPATDSSFIELALFEQQGFRRLREAIAKLGSHGVGPGRSWPSLCSIRAASHSVCALASSCLRVDAADVEARALVLGVAVQHLRQVHGDRRVRGVELVGARQRASRRPGGLPERAPGRCPGPASCAAPSGSPARRSRAVNSTSASAKWRCLAKEPAVVVHQVGVVRRQLHRAVEALVGLRRCRRVTA